MKRFAVALALVFSFVAHKARAQEPILGGQWPGPLEFGVQHADAEALRGIPDLKLSILAAPMVEGVNKPFAIETGMAPAKLREGIEQKLNAAGVTLTADSRHALNFSLGLVCSPAPATVCWVQMFFVLHEPARTILGKPASATVWETVLGFMVPEADLGRWVQTYVDRAVDRFTQDWKQAHP